MKMPFPLQFLAAAFFFGACDARPKSFTAAGEVVAAAVAPAVAPAPPQSTLPSSIIVSRESTDEQIEAYARTLIVRQPGTDELSDDQIVALLTLAPELQARDLFWKWVGAVPAAQVSAFRPAILSSLKALAPKPNRGTDPEFRTGYRIASQLRDPEVAQIALEQLPLVTPYHFPDTPPPPGWMVGNAENVERLAHGDQGVVASTIVKLADRQTLGKYREMLQTAEPLTQRTMIWALGNSIELKDFELLMTMRPRISDPGTLDTLTRALNRIAQSMESASKFTELIPRDRDDLNPEILAQNAASCKAQLAQRDLVVATTFFD